MEYKCEVLIANKIRFDVDASSQKEAEKIAKQRAAEKLNANEFVEGLSVVPKMVVNGRPV